MALMNQASRFAGSEKCGKSQVAVESVDLVEPVRCELLL